MIRVQHLHVSLQGKEILHDLSFELPDKKIVMLLGENGSGKTTLIRSLLRQIPYTGTIYADDQDVSLMKVKQLAEIFSYVPQKKEIVEDLRVEDCMVSGFARTISPFSIPTKQHYQKAQNLLDKWNLSHIKGKLLQEISGGELQMTYVARAFLQDANVMIMDEPCTYLDYRRQHQFLREVVQRKKEGKSMLISMHDPNLALQYADEILLLHQGKLYAHIKGDRQQLIEECCDYYEQLYGDIFQVKHNETGLHLVWKED
ncbi:ABC transporter ATP-binding protein [Erysipelotrichaceae bacterium HCN-30851]